MHSIRLLIIACAYVGLTGAVLIGYRLSPSFTADVIVGGRINSAIQMDVLVLPAMMCLGLYMWGAFRAEIPVSIVETAVKTLFGMLTGIASYLVINAVFAFSLTGRYVLAFTGLAGQSFILFLSIAYSLLGRRYARLLAIVGTHNAVNAVDDDVRKSHLPLRVVRKIIFSPRTNTRNLSDFSPDLMRNIGISEILVDAGAVLPSEEREVLMDCVARGINVIELSAFYEARFERVYIPGLDERWFWSYDPARIHPHYLAFKRLLDISLSSIGMLALLPFWPFIALAIKLQDGGRVFYVQTRVGLYGKSFQILKFRTMRANAELKGAQWAKTNDPRVTALGRLLRKTRVDELPQLWNIFKGEMSFVGPRPERPEFVAQLEHVVAFYKYRHLIKPGLSGWAQINYPYGASVEDARQKLSYDLYYLKNASIYLDLVITLRTVAAMMRGAR